MVNCRNDGDKLGFPVFPLEWKTEETTATGYRENGFSGSSSELSSF
jgi:hypothetical protein